MSEEPTLPTGSDYRIVTVCISEETYNRLILATQVSGSPSSEHLAGKGIIKYVEQIEMAHKGTVFQAIDKSTGATTLYAPPELFNAFEHGHNQRAQAQTPHPVNRQPFKAIPGGKSI